MAAFIEFVLKQLPAPPARILELGPGEKGGVTRELAARGYDVLGIDPHAPDEPPFRRITLDDLPEPNPFDAAVAGNVLHHVRPLGRALDKLARLAPLLVIEEFAWERFPGPAAEWYESQHRILRAAGLEPKGPPDLGEWRARHADLHPSEVVLAELRARYTEVALERPPFFQRWLGGVATEELERSLVAAGAIPAIGVRWSGRAKSGRREIVPGGASSRPRGR